MTRRRALASALLAAALVAVALAAFSGRGGDENGGELPTPAEAYSEITERTAEEGSRPELALEAFAGVFGPIAAGVVLGRRVLY